MRKFLLSWLNSFRDPNIDYSLRRGDQVMVTTSNSFLCECTVVDVNFALKAIAVSLRTTGDHIVVIPLSTVKKVPL